MTELVERTLSDTRKSRTVKLEVGGTDFYITAGEFDDGSLAEIFVQLGGNSDTIQGLIDAWCITFSMAIQGGADWERLARILVAQKFDPRGQTNDPSIPEIRSVIDYVCRWCAKHYGSVRLVADLDRMLREL